jgi:hypothetical protein
MTHNKKLQHVSPYSYISDQNTCIIYKALLKIQAEGLCSSNLNYYEWVLCFVYCIVCQKKKSYLQFSCTCVFMLLLYYVVKFVDRNTYPFVDQLSPLDHVAETDLSLPLEDHGES